MDVGQHRDRRLADRRVDRRGIDDAERAAGECRDATGDVEVGREIAGLCQDRAGRGGFGGGGDQLEEVDRRRIGNEHLVVGGADQPRDLGADTGGRVDPPGLVPATDQPLAPLVRDDVGEAAGGGGGQRAERVAVEVDDAGGQREAIAEAAQRIGGVERPRRIEIGRNGGGAHERAVAEPAGLVTAPTPA